MKFTQLFLFNALLTVLAITNAQASHIMGGDLTYECTNNPGEYEFTFTFIRDCKGVSAYTAIPLKLNSSCGDSDFIYLLPTNVVDITPLCNSQTSVCAGGGGDYGVERHRYKAIRQFTIDEANCTNWTANIRLVNRNKAITTIYNPGDTDMTISHAISSPFENTSCNNSPVFTNNPNVFACVNQPTFYNHGATDIDGDDLVFSLIPCQDENGSVDYKPPFSGTNPITGSFSIDPNTGQIEFTATAIQVAIFCVLVQEYRNGVLIGEVIRDIELTVTPCNNNLPIVSGVNGSTDFTITSSLCANKVCFDIDGSDPDPGDNVTLSWNYAIPNGTFGVYNNGSATPEGVVCFIPSDLGLGNHTFTVTAEDDNCPLVGQNTFTYQINVIDTGSGDVDFSPFGCLNNLSCNASGFSLQAHPAGGGSGNQTYQWTSGETKFAIWVCDPGTYGVTITDGACIFKGDFVLPDIDYDVFVAGDGFTCTDGVPTGGYSLNASENLGDDPGVTPISYQWTSNDAIIDAPNDHAIWITPSDIISYPATFDVVTTTNLGEVCGSYTIDDPECDPCGGNVDFVTDGCLNNLSCYASQFNLEAFLAGGGSGGPYTYEWNHNLSTDPVVKICAPGTYGVKITDGACIFKDEFILPDIDYDVYPASDGFTCTDGVATGGYSLNASENLGDDPDVWPISYQWTSNDAIIEPWEENNHAIWVTPNDIITYPATYEVKTITNLGGEVCGTYTIEDPGCVHCDENGCCDNFIVYGDEYRNIPIAIKHYDGFTYVAGTVKTDSVYATFTKFDATNNVVWEKQFSQSSSIFDFVKTDHNEFLLVGRTEPIYDNGIKNNRSILAKIDDMGNEVFIRTYDNGQREKFAKIVEHPQAVDSNNPYYIAAYENVGDQSPSAKDEVQLYNLNANGDINWEIAYTTPNSNNLDDQFARNLVCTADGNLLLIGDIEGSNYIGALLSVSGVDGKVILSFEGDNNTLFYDAKELSTGNIVLAGSSFANGAPQFAFLMLLDKSLNVISSEAFALNQVKNITTLQVDAKDDLFGVGQLKSGLPCIVKMEVISNRVIVNEVKSIPGHATSYTVPAAHHLTNSTLYYADGRDEKTASDIDMFTGYFDTALTDDCLIDEHFKTDRADYKLIKLLVKDTVHNLPAPYNTIDLIDVRLPIESDCEEVPGTCCVDEAAFISRTENILTNAPDLEECELFITITTLAECDQVTIDWGEGPLEGPFTGNVISTHTYPSAGTYKVCLRYEEIDEDGTVCWEVVNCFEVNANCEPGICCADEAAFIDRTDDIITNAPDLEECELFITTTELTEWDQVTIDWGDGPTEGPYTGNINLSHIYTTPGTYTVCLYFVEIDETGNACWEAAHCFEVNANCEPTANDCYDEISALKDQVNKLEDEIDLLIDVINQLSGNEKRMVNNTDLKLYPNPTNGNFYVEYNIGESLARVDIVITDLKGVEVISKTEECTKNCTSHFQLPNSLSDGMYYCSLFANGQLVDSVSFIYKK